MEKGFSFIILIVVIAILTLTVAVLAGFIFLNNSDAKPAEQSAVEQENTAPDVTDLFKMDLFTKQLFNLKKTDDKQVAVLQVSAKLVCYKTKEQQKVQEHVALFQDEIIEMIGIFFLSKTKEEIDSAEFRVKVKSELVKKINELIKSSSKKSKMEEDLVYDIVFYDWLTQ